MLKQHLKLVATPMRFGCRVFLMFAVSCLPLVFSACGDDEPKYVEPADTESTVHPGSNNNQDGVKYNILIDDNVSVSHRYDNYCWYFTVTSSLDKALPGHTISYTLAHGAISGADEAVSITANGDGLYQVRKTQAGDKTIITYRIPFYFYYIAQNALNSVDTDTTTYQMLLMSYFTLIEKDSLTSQERIMLSELKQELGKGEALPKIDWKVWLFVSIDGQKYPPFPSYTI